MDEWELIESTIDKLLDRFKKSEGFFNTDHVSATIYIGESKFIEWRPSINEQKNSCFSESGLRVRISYIAREGIFRCTVGREEHSYSTNIEAGKLFTPIRSLYRKFMNLRKLIYNFYATRNNNKYVEELSHILPEIVDDLILKGEK